MIQASSFDLTEAIKCITEHHFQRVVCQFPDEYLACCTEVYLLLADQVPLDCDIFIAADSTFGSSVDDISAAHVDADLLIFFGSDLSGSGSVNVMIIPPMKAIDTQKCADALVSVLKDIDSGRSEDVVSTFLAPTLLIIDPCYLHARTALTASLGGHFSCLETGHLPACLGLAGHWLPSCEQTPVVIKGSPTEQVGGVYFAAQDVNNAVNVVYIGEKEEQLASLFLRLSQQRILRYSPQTQTEIETQTETQTETERGIEIVMSPAVEVFQGDGTRVFRERYGGVSKVKAAKIIGLLVGSMGIETENLQTIVKQLQTLITAAGKKFYVFVLGRINEAKLCNFPEVRMMMVMMMVMVMMMMMMMIVVMIVMIMMMVHVKNYSLSCNLCYMLSTTG
jgi:diphthamide biosynthesis protein 2